MKTKERIRETARDLFNTHQFGRVTTAMLAAELAISEGNLWYHYRTKRALLDAISEQYLLDLESRLSLEPDPAGDVLEQFGAFLAQMAQEQARYQFIYRDRADYGEHSAVLQARIPEIYGASRYQFEQFFHALRAAGHLRIPEPRIEPVVMNAILILRYAPEFHREVGLPTLPATKAVKRMIAQHLSVYEDCFTPEAAEALNADLERRLSSPALDAEG